jgi:hypothetical protein
MDASQDLQSDVGASRRTGLGGRRLAAAVLAAVAAGLLAQPASAQTAFPPTMDMAAPGLPATVTMPDPFALAEQALRCDMSATCLERLLQTAVPALEPSALPSPPASPSPAPSEPSGGGEPAAPPPKDGPRASPGPSAAPADRPRKRPQATEGASLASRPELAEIVASPAGLRERAAAGPLPAPAAPPRGPDPLGGSAPVSLVPVSLPGFDWSPFLLNVLLAGASLALLFFLLMATPQHSAGQVSYWLADRRSDLGLLGAVMLVALAVGYFIATSVG